MNTPNLTNPICKAYTTTFEFQLLKSTNFHQFFYIFLSFGELKVLSLFQVFFSCLYWVLQSTNIYLYTFFFYLQYLLYLGLAIAVVVITFNHFYHCFCYLSVLVYFGTAGDYLGYTVYNAFHNLFHFYLIAIVST